MGLGGRAVTGQLIQVFVHHEGVFWFQTRAHVTVGKRLCILELLRCRIEVLEALETLLDDPCICRKLVMLNPILGRGIT